MTAAPNAIEVFAADGTKVSGRARQVADERFVSPPLRVLARGAYTVRWRALSADGHVVAGVFTFGAGVPAPPPTEAYGATGPGWTDDAARWAYFVALAVLLGTLGVRLLVLPAALPARLARRLSLVALAGGPAAANVGIAAFHACRGRSAAVRRPPLRRPLDDRDQDAFRGRLRGDDARLRLGDGAAPARVDPRGSALLWPAFLGMASGLSLSGHSAVEPNSTWLSQLADWLHLAGSLWAGGLVVLASCVWPLAPELRRAAFLRFSRLATVLVAVLVLAGTYLGILRLPELADLWGTAYERTLLVKLALVSVALAWGATHHFLVRPRLERGGAPAGQRRSLLGESTVAVAVLLVAAVLVDSPPPASEPAGGDRAGAPVRALAR